MKFAQATLLIFALTSSSYAQVSTPEPKTQEGVVAADNAWMQAEMRGDGAFLSNLLLDGYVSIDPSGRITTKQQIVASAITRGNSPSLAKEVAAWDAAHPSKASVQMFGDTAVLTWVSTIPNSQAPVYSSDVFVYREGKWRAAYSQHSTAAE